MQSLLEQLGEWAANQPLLYAGVTLGVIIVFAVAFGQLMDWLSKAVGLDTSRRTHTQNRVGE